MPEGDLVAHGLLGHRPVERVEALEPRIGVVVAVGVLAVAQELPGQLDLVRRVVHVEPRVGRLAQAGLERDGRRCKQADDRRRQRDREPAGPARDERRRSCGERDQHAGQEPGRADRLGVPLPVGPADEPGERPTRIDRTRPEVPRLGAEEGDGDEDDQPERAEQRPDGDRAEPAVVPGIEFGEPRVGHEGAGAGVRVTDGWCGRAGDVTGSRSAWSAAAAIPRIAQTSGSSKNTP